MLSSPTTTWGTAPPGRGCTRTEFKESSLPRTHGASNLSRTTGSRRRAHRPARTGMDPHEPRHRPRDQSTPRTHGDRPPKALVRLLHAGFPPPARGCTTRFLSAAEARRTVPRTPGDTPTAFKGIKSRSPHARGQTVGGAGAGGDRGPFPARTGMNRRGQPWRGGHDGFPRTPGDEPDYRAQVRGIFTSAPHARGSTRHTLDAPARTGNDLSDKLCACRE